jgi:hypothetical protein
MFGARTTVARFCSATDWRHVPLVQPFRSSLARAARSTRLLVLAALRTAGWVPWLLAAGWVVVAALQEPRLLRAHGIELVAEAAWIAAAALAFALGAAMRAPNAMIPYLAAITILTILCAGWSAAIATAAELARGPSTAFPLRLPVMRVTLALAPVAAFASLVAAHRAARVWPLVAVALLCALANLPRSVAAFSLANAIASIACFASAAALACGHRQKHA